MVGWHDPDMKGRNRRVGRKGNEVLALQDDAPPVSALVLEHLAVGALANLVEVHTRLVGTHAHLVGHHG